MSESKLSWYDSHCHLDRFPEHINIEEIVKQAQSIGVKDFFVPGVVGAPDKIEELVRIPAIKPGWGIHPSFVRAWQTNSEQHFKEFLSNYGCFGIGECGLDKRSEYKLDKQLALFEWQISLALEYNLPLIVHLVGHYEPALKLLRSAGRSLRFVIHSFTGSVELAERFIDLGGNISLSGSILKKNRAVVKALLDSIPRNKLMLETDCPSQKPAFCKNEYNTPEIIPKIAMEIANISDIDIETLSLMLYKNSNDFFS